MLLKMIVNPANIRWSSRRLEDFFNTSSALQFFFFKDVLKTSSRRLGRRKIVTLKMPSRRLEDIPWRRLEDMSWRRLEDISWRRLEEISWRRLQDVLETKKCLPGISVSKKSKCVYFDLTNLYLTNLHLTNLRRIQNALVRTQ